MVRVNVRSNGNGEGAERDRCRDVQGGDAWRASKSKVLDADVREECRNGKDPGGQPPGELRVV